MSDPAKLQLLHCNAASAAVGCPSASSPAAILSVSTLEFSCCFHGALQPYGFMVLL